MIDIFFFHGSATTEIYTLSLHDALPISRRVAWSSASWLSACHSERIGADNQDRSEEHTSELQSRRDLVCRLLLEKKKSRGPPARPVAGSGLYGFATPHESAPNPARDACV